MKRMMPVFLLCALLMTGCDDYDYDEPETTVSQTETAESAEKTMPEDTGISDEATETCSDWIFPESTETLPELSENQEITTMSEETVPDNYEYEEEQEPEIIEIPEETVPEPTEAQPEVTSIVTEETTDFQTESVIQTESMTETETIPETVESTETEPITESEPMTEPVTETTTVPETAPEQEVTDFEKAQSVYEYMLENGHGTCVNYACQTYEKCLEIGLPCYIIWTDAGLYGHTANTVCVNGIWFVLDTQAGAFLESNYGFTEVVNMDCEHIADGDILSNYSYQELFE